MTTNHDIEKYIYVCLTSRNWEKITRVRNNGQVSYVFIESSFKKVSCSLINHKFTFNFIVLSPWRKSLLHPLTQKMIWKRLIYNLDRAQYVMSKARNKINKGSEDMSGYQYDLASKNSVIDVNISKILDINMGWGYNVSNQGYLDPDQGE